MHVPQEYSMSLGEMVKALREIRNKKRELDEKYRKKRAQLLEYEEVVSQAIITAMSELGLDALSTPHGKVQRVVKETPFVTDWEKFHAYVLENGALDLLHKRLSQKVALERIEEGEEIPGVHVNREYVLRVQKPSNKR